MKINRDGHRLVVKKNKMFNCLNFSLWRCAKLMCHAIITFAVQYRFFKYKKKKTPHQNKMQNNKYMFLIKTMFGSSLSPILCKRANVIFTLFRYSLTIISKYTILLKYCFFVEKMIVRLG